MPKPYSQYDYENRMAVLNKIETTDEKMKMLYQWVKSEVINFTLFNDLIHNVFGIK